MSYKMRWDAINALEVLIRGKQSTNTNGAEKTKGISPDIDDEILDLLIMSYIYGAEQANEDLETEIAPSIEDMEKAIYKRIDGKDFVDRVRIYASANDVEAIIKVIETDANRVYNTGAADTAVKGGAKTKTWRSMEDDKVRDSHIYLNGMTVGVNDYFFTFDNNYAMFPGDFGIASEDCNCRCYAEYSR